MITSSPPSDRSLDDALAASERAPRAAHGDEGASGAPAVGAPGTAAHDAPEPTDEVLPTVIMAPAVGLDTGVSVAPGARAEASPGALVASNEDALSVDPAASLHALPTWTAAEAAPQAAPEHASEAAARTAASADAAHAHPSVAGWRTRDEALSDAEVDAPTSLFGDELAHAFAAARRPAFHDEGADVDELGDAETQEAVWASDVDVYTDEVTRPAARSPFAGLDNPSDEAAVTHEAPLFGASLASPPAGPGDVSGSLSGDGHGVPYAKSQAVDVPRVPTSEVPSGGAAGAVGGRAAVDVPGVLSPTARRQQPSGFSRPPSSPWSVPASPPRAAALGVGTGDGLGIGAVRGDAAGGARTSAEPVLHGPAAEGIERVRPAGVHTPARDSLPEVTDTLHAAHAPPGPWEEDPRVVHVGVVEALLVGGALGLVVCGVFWVVVSAGT